MVSSLPPPRPRAVPRPRCRLGCQRENHGWELWGAREELGSRGPRCQAATPGRGRWLVLQTGGKGADSQQNSWEKAAARGAERDGIGSASPAAGVPARLKPTGVPRGAHPRVHKPAGPSSITRQGATASTPAGEVGKLRHSRPGQRRLGGLRWLSLPARCPSGDVGDAGSHGPFLPLAGRGAKKKRKT